MTDTSIQEITKKMYEFDQVNNRGGSFKIGSYDFEDIVQNEYKNLVATMGYPVNANIRVISPSVGLPRTWDDLTVDLGGKLFTLSDFTTVQMLLDDGYRIIDENKFENTIVGPHNSSSCKVKNDETHMIIELDAENNSDVAYELKDCIVYGIYVRRDWFMEDYELDGLSMEEIIDELPEFFLPSALEWEKNGAEAAEIMKNDRDCAYTTYLTWDAGNLVSEYYDSCSDYDQHSRLYELRQVYFDTASTLAYGDNTTTKDGYIIVEKDGEEYYIDIDIDKTGLDTFGMHRRSY